MHAAYTGWKSTLTTGFHSFKVAFSETFPFWSPCKQTSDQKPLPFFSNPSGWTFREVLKSVHLSHTGWRHTSTNMNNYALVTYPSVVISLLWDFSVERILSVHLSGSQNRKWLKSTRSCSPNSFRRLQHPSNPTLYELFSLSAWSTILLTVYNSIHCSQPHSLFTGPFTVHSPIHGSQPHSLFTVPFTVYNPIQIHCSQCHPQRTITSTGQNLLLYL